MSNKQNNILVCGSNGQLGRELQVLAKTENNFQFLFTDVQELDITNKEQVREMVGQNGIQAIVNCAAYTAVDDAEDHVKAAELVNVTGPENLAMVSSEFNIPIIHVSTDYVFDGSKNTPYTEEDRVNPLGVYGLTKLAGEQAVSNNNPKSIIIRTSWLYSNYGKNFMKTMLRLTAEKEELGVIFDQTGTPTYANDLAKAIIVILGDEALSEKAGVYHFSNEGVCSWYDFTQAIKDIAGNSCKLNPILTGQYPTKAKRPQYSVLNKSKIKTTFGVEIPYWMNSLKECINANTVEE